MLQDQPHELLDHKQETAPGKLSQSLIMLYISIGIIVLAILFFSLVGSVFEHKHSIYGALILMFAFGVNIAGTILGFNELSLHRKKAIVGIVCNLFLVILFIVIILIATSFEDA